MNPSSPPPKFLFKSLRECWPRYHHCSTLNSPESLSYLNKILKSLMRSHILVHGCFSACFWLPSLLKGSHLHSIPVSLRASTADSHPLGSHPAYAQRFSPNPWFLPSWVPYKCHAICEGSWIIQTSRPFCPARHPPPPGWLQVAPRPMSSSCVCFPVCFLCLPKKTSVLCGWGLAGFTVCLPQASSSAYLSRHEMHLGSISKIKFYHLDHYKLITRKTGMKLGNQVKRIR